ncbi:MAG: [LysW]-aminoadipate kinase [Aggregatilineaceae bacterium]
MIHVLKIGGGAGIDPAPVLDNLARRIAGGEQWVVVHGASDEANRLAGRVGLTVQTLTGPDGHVSRYTDAQMIELYSAAAGLVNQRLVAGLAARGVCAAGLAGPAVITARRKTAIRALRNGRPVVVRDDFSGSIEGVDERLLRLLLQGGYTPIIAPLALGTAGERLNVDGDLVAATVARVLQADSLIILSNVPGLLRDPADPSSVVSGFSLGDLPRYEPLAQGRMKKKLLAAREARVPLVILSDAGLPAPLDAALAGAGTHILAETEAQHVGHTG